MTTVRRWGHAVGVVALMILWGADARCLEQPRGPVILTIAAQPPGSLGNVNPAGVADFDEAMLDALPEAKIVTATPWSEGVHAYTGPRLADVLAIVGAQGSALTVAALNDYAITVPVKDAAAYGAILARRMDGRPLTVRDKGPLFLVYPFDSTPDLRNDSFYARAVWQIRSITVR